MHFLVSANHSGRAYAFERTSMNDALEKGLALLGSGMLEVMITHPDGRRTTPAEFLAVFARPRAQKAEDVLRAAA